MTRANDTVPDHREDADTDPSSQSVTTAPANVNEVAALVTALPAKGGGRNDSTPGLDMLLGGLHGRPPVEALEQAESNGADAAEYQAVVVPGKAHQVAQLAPVIFANTEPLPHALDITRRSADAAVGRSETAPLALARPPTPPAVAAAAASVSPSSSAPRTPLNPQRDAATVPGARQAKRDGGRAAIIGGAVLLVLGVIVYAIVFRPWVAEPSVTTEPVVQGVVSVGSAPSAPPVDTIPSSTTSSAVVPAVSAPPIASAGARPTPSFGRTLGGSAARPAAAPPPASATPKPSTEPTPKAATTHPPAAPAGTPEAVHDTARGI